MKTHYSIIECSLRLEGVVTESFEALEVLIRETLRDKLGLESMDSVDLSVDWWIGSSEPGPAQIFVIAGNHRLFKDYVASVAYHGVNPHLYTYVGSPQQLHGLAPETPVLLAEGWQSRTEEVALAKQLGLTVTAVTP